MSKVWIVDRWTYSAGERKGTPSPVDGKGLRWRVVWIDPGTRVERSKQFAKRKGVGGADEFRTKMEDSLRSGVYLDPRHAAMSFREASERYRTATYSKGGTTATRERLFRTRVIPKWGERPLGSIQRTDIEDWVQEMIAGTAPLSAARVGAANGPLGPSTIKSLVSAMSAVYSYAIDHGWIARNPASRVGLPKVVDHEHRYLSIPEIESLARAAGMTSDHDIDRVLVLTLAYTGIRVGEATSLYVSDFDPVKRRLMISKTWAEHGTGKTIDTPKSGKTRQVPVPAFLMEELAALAADRAPGDYLFTAKRGGAVNMHNWRRRVWDKSLATTTIGKLTPHDLRHSAASMAIAQSANVLVVQTMLGHSSPVETLETYSHLWPDRLDEVADGMNEARKAALIGLAA